MNNNIQMYVKFISKPNEWFDAGTEVFDGCINDWDKPLKRITVEKYEKDWKPWGIFLGHGLRNGELDQEDCPLHEFEISYTREQYMNYVKLISVTPDSEKIIAYCARVSNPNNQTSNNIAKLLKYCIDHKHWSIFEMAHLTLEINTTRGLAAQILRHKSFSFQEFSQRYADTSLLGKEIPLFDLRSQDSKNRQNSIDNIPDHIKYKWNSQIREHFSKSQSLYNDMIKDGVAKECARFILPLATPTRLYMCGSIRSWITYISLREKNGTQKEHMDVAKECKQIFCEQFPIISESLGGLNQEWII